MTAQHYQFLPYARTALTSAAGAAGAAAVRLQARLSVRVGRATQQGDVAVDQGAESADVTVSLYGPGDAVGIDRAQVVRTVPEAGDWDVEPNYLAAVEFDAPELPWLLTPRLPDAGGRLDPWIVLVVVPDGPEVLGSAVGCVLPVLRVALDDLPDLDESWAWAHVQVLSDETEAAELQAMLADRGADASTLSRLICPRHLDPDTAYVAAVVPSFAAGVAAAGLDVPEGATDAPAWGPNSRSPVELPVYHLWRFRTGRSGDFECLARLLHPVLATTVGLGRRAMAVVPADIPGGEGAHPYVVQLRSALTTVDAGPDAPPAAAAVEEAALEALVNAAAGLAEAEVPDPVAPPVYGEWLAGRRTVDRTVAEPRDWLDGLNLAPEGRVPAAAGGDVVRRDQEELMAKAWDQVGDVDRANQALRWMQLSLVANRRLCTARVDRRTATSKAQLFRPAGARLPFTVGSPGTLAQRLAATPLPSATLDSTYTKVSMRAARRAQVPAGRLVAQLSNRMLGEEAVLAPPQGELLPRDFSDLAAVRSSLAESGGLARLVGNSASTVAQTFDAVDELPALLAAVTARSPEPTNLEPPSPEPQSPESPSPEPPASGVAQQEHGLHVGHWLDVVREAQAEPPEEASPAGGFAVGRALGRKVGRERFVRVHPVGRELHVTSVSALTKAWLDQASPRIDALKAGMALPAAGAVARAHIGERLSAAAGRALADTDSDSLLADRIGLARPVTKVDLGAVAALPADKLAQAIAEVRDRIVLDADSPRATVLSGLAADELDRALAAAVAPERTLGILASARVKVDPSQVSRGLTRLLHPMMRSPRFTEPVAGRLRGPAQEHLLANAEKLEPNGITLLTTNPRFVEALMVGINHEMARELLYRGYPTDRRGTCFRQFWPRLDGQDDIAAVTDWDGGELGTHSAGGMEGQLVVLLRGDLLRRYPRTIVTARKGTVSQGADGDAKFVEDPGTRPRQAIFGDSIPPDIRYVGLDLSQAEAKHDGWFILLEQPPTEPRFGLDVEPPPPPPGEPPPAPQPPAGWNDLNWQHAELLNGHLSAKRDGVATPSSASPWAWGVDASQTAAILLQQPFRLALRADRYLGPGA